MASKFHQDLHFLLIPLLSQSHIIPLTDFAKLLAKRGLIVSIITTPLNAIRYKPTIQHAVESGMQIQLISLEFPGQEAGLPPGCENLDSLTSVDLATEFFTACEMLKTPLQKIIQKLEPNPSCIISTNALPWTQELADSLRIPRYVFETVSCFTLLCSQKMSQAQIPETNGSFFVPDIPHKIEFTKSQLPETRSKSSDNVKGVIDQIIKAQRSASGTVVNSCEELEPCVKEVVEEEGKGFVMRNQVKKCVEELMGEEVEGIERRRRAQKLGEMAKEALQEGGSSYLNIGPMDITDVREQVRKNESEAYGVVVNSFEEVEKRHVDEFRKLKGGKVWCIGPLSLSCNDNLDIAERGNQASMDFNQVLNWLDNMNAGSVIYACLGSLSRLSPAQF
ncbi:hypothetical protein BUALT_Bualt11G0105700 [Buddleja alternifolia]|uniref:Uncharacterized protein n=1 Tax=Buddleja alternifolia TaxID=168488 RepID=A0AAV6X220_9LAMI|nr:hypothetical protein BUALT_Bualt11G0105700 [Buddleja alternifolia]